MLELPADLPGADDYLPDWTVRRLIVLEKTERWMPAVAAEVYTALSSAVAQHGPRPVFESCTTAREAVLFGELQNTVGFILFMDQLERECLGVLARLGRLRRPLRVLVVATRRHADLVPVLMESGADAVLVDVADDVPIADWCLKVLTDRV